MPDPNTVTVQPSTPDYASEGGSTNATATAQIAAMYPWLPAEALAAYDQAYRGGAVDPWAIVRQDTRYEVWFPGNKLENGQVRYAESAYAGVIEGYELAFGEIGLNPDLFRNQFGDFIRGDLSPDELFEDRLMPTYERVWEASESIRQEYSQRFGVEMTFEGIMASALDPALGEQILAGRITQAEIAGEARESGIQISEELLTRLQEAGFDRRQADELFTGAQAVLPVLSVLARRHNDPDDDFNIEDFSAGEVFGDPRERRRMRSLIRSETGIFANTNLGIATSRSGAKTGLEA